MKIKYFKYFFLPPSFILAAAPTGTTTGTTTRAARIAPEVAIPSPIPLPEGAATTTAIVARMILSKQSKEVYFNTFL